MHPPTQKQERERRRRGVDREWITRRKRLIKAGVAEFVKEEKVGSGASARIMRHMHAVTPGQFERALAKCQIWLQEHARRPYALLLGSSTDWWKDPAGGRMHHQRINSTRWLSRHVVSVLGAPALEMYADHTDRNESPYHSAYARAQALGIKSIVHLNDALYSGSQIEEVIEGLTDAAGDNVPMTIPLFIAVAFSTADAVNRITATRQLQLMCSLGLCRNDTRSSLHPDSRVYVASLIPDLPLSNRFFDATATLTIMPHKVPNALSFGLPGGDRNDRNPKHMSAYVANHVGSTAYHGRPNAIKLPRNYDPERYSRLATNRQRAHARTAGEPI